MYYTEYNSKNNLVLSSIVIDHAHPEIADNLFITERTVVGHKSHLLAKTETKSAISSLAYVIKMWLVI